jgi:predicted PhzF superfamily epimerase YddE/YHI9
VEIPIFQVDAFTSRLFHGNPAAVCPLSEWPDDAQLLAIAAENNLSETGFVVGSEGRYQLRWFTPAIEVDLCGHATLAAAFVIFNFIDKPISMVEFTTKSGLLTVRREDTLLCMEFPARPASPCPTPDQLIEGLGVQPAEVYLSRDYLAVYGGEEEVRSLRPKMEPLLSLDGLGVIVTSQGKESDFVSRFFAPKAGIPEDPVTGSAHCTLVPYWAARLGKERLYALQLSRRGGELFCEKMGDRVRIAGKAVLYMEGVIRL